MGLKIDRFDITLFLVHLVFLLHLYSLSTLSGSLLFVSSDVTSRGPLLWDSLEILRWPFLSFPQFFMYPWIVIYSAFCFFMSALILLVSHSSFKKQIYLLSSLFVEMFLAALAFNLDLFMMLTIAILMLFIHCLVSFSLRFLKVLQATNIRSKLARYAFVGFLALNVVLIGYFASCQPFNSLWAIACYIVYVAWAAFIVILPGLAILSLASKDDNEPAIFNLFLALAFGTLLMSVVSWILLELSTALRYYQGFAIPLFNPVTLSIFPIVSGLYLWRRKNCRRFLHKTFFISKIDVFFLGITGLLLTILAFRFLSSSLLELPWFDIWSFWGAGYRAANQGYGFLRFSYFFPGQNSMVVPSLLAMNFAILPDKMSTLFFMKFVPISIAFLQSLGIYAILRVVLPRINHSVERTLFGKIAPLLGAIIFISSPWTQFYLTSYIRESLGIVIVLAISAVIIKLKTWKMFALSIPLAFLIVYTSAAQLAAVIALVPAFAIGSLTLKDGLNLRKAGKRLIVVSAIALVCILPFLISNVIIDWRITNGFVGEMLRLNSPVSLQESVQSVVLVYPNFNESMLWLKYNIVNSVGPIAFLSLLIFIPVAFTLVKRYNHERFFLLFMIFYTAVLVTSPFWAFSFLVGDMRRFAFQISIVSAMAVPMILAFAWDKFLVLKIRLGKNIKIGKLGSKTMISVALIFLLINQINFALLVSPAIDNKSQLSVSEMLLKIDEGLAKDAVVVADHPILDQAMGLLSNRYIYDPGEFVETFSPLLKNETGRELLSKEMADYNLVIIACGENSILSEFVSAATEGSLDGVIAGSIGVYRFLMGEAYQNVYAVGSTRILQPIIMLFNSNNVGVDLGSDLHDVQLFSCDSTNGLKCAQEIAVSEIEKVEGTGSIQSSGSSDFGVFCTFDEPVNLLTFDYVAFWVKTNSTVSSPQVYLSDGTNQAYNNFRILDSEWNYYAVPINNFVSTGSSQVNFSRITVFELWFGLVRSNGTFFFDDVRIFSSIWKSSKLPLLNYTNGSVSFTVRAKGQDEWYTVDKPLPNGSLSGYTLIAVQTQINDPSIISYVEARDDVNSKYYPSFLGNAVKSDERFVLIVAVPLNSSITAIRIGFHILPSTPSKYYELRLFYIRAYRA